MPPTRLTEDLVSLEKEASTEQRDECEASTPLSSLFKPYILSHSQTFDKNKEFTWKKTQSSPTPTRQRGLRTLALTSNNFL